MKYGFTLIELLVVVVIIGILSAIAIPNFVAMQIKAKEASIKENMHTLQLTAEDFNTRAGGVYPGDLSTRISTVNNNIQPPAGDKCIAEHLLPPYGLNALLPDNVVNAFHPMQHSLQNKRCELGDLPGIIGYEASNTPGDNPELGEPWNETGDGPAIYYRITGMGKKGPLLLVKSSGGTR